LTNEKGQSISKKEAEERLRQEESRVEAPHSGVEPFPPFQIESSAIAGQELSSQVTAADA
jgi:hypothetical protein